MLTSKQGYVVHKFEMDGEASICVRASTASKDNPMRFGLRVKTVENDPLFKPKGEGPDVNTHLGHIESEMMRIEGGMKSILAEADYQKNQDWLYHQVGTSLFLLTCFRECAVLPQLNCFTHHLSPTKLYRHALHTAIDGYAQFHVDLANGSSFRSYCDGYGTSQSHCKLLQESAYHISG
jgi:hypothetical protein